MIFANIKTIIKHTELTVIIVPSSQLDLEVNANQIIFNTKNRMNPHWYMYIKKYVIL